MFKRSGLWCRDAKSTRSSLVVDPAALNSWQNYPEKCRQLEVGISTAMVAVSPVC